MRLAVCVKRDLFGLIAARAFLGALGAPWPEVTVFCSTRTRPAEADHSLPLLLKALERDIPIDTLLAATEAERRALPAALRPEAWHPLPDLKPVGGAAALLGFRPDMIVSMRFSLIFPPAVIDAVPGGILNLHPGPLPGYRGLFAPFWQVLAGEADLAATLHLVDAGIDTGAVLAEHRVARRTGRSLLWHMGELYRGGAVLAARAVRRAERGIPPVGTAQPPGGRYHRIPGAEAADAFLAGSMPVVATPDYLALLAEALSPALPGGAMAAAS
jgi:hypothetical protein